MISNRFPGFLALAIFSLNAMAGAAITLVQSVKIGEYDTQYLVTNGVHLPMPAGVQAGDVAVVWLGVGNTTATASAPAGWTAITGASHLKNSYIGAAAFYKVLAQEDVSASYLAFSVTGSSTTIVGFMDIYRGVDSQQPIAVASVRQDGSYSATPPCPALSIPAQGCLIIALLASEGNPGDMTPPTGFTSHGSVWWPKVCSADNGGSSVAAGTYTASNWTLQQGKQTLGCMVALLPAGTTRAIADRKETEAGNFNASRLRIVAGNEKAILIHSQLYRFLLNGKMSPTAAVCAATVLRQVKGEECHEINHY